MSENFAYTIEFWNQCGRAYSEFAAAMLVQAGLLHELLHWRRWDLHLNFLQSCLQILYFYNPAVWLANVAIRRLREQAVDEAVLVLLQARPEQYSETLLRIAGAERVPCAVPLRLIGVIESGRTLATRIRRMLAGPPPRRESLGVSGVCTVLVAGIFLLPMARSRSAEGETTQSTPPGPRADTEAVTTPGPAPQAAAVDGQQLVRQLIDKSQLWTQMPPGQLRSLQYTYELGHDSRPVQLVREGWSGWTGMWFGATLGTGTHGLLRFPDRWDIRADRIDPPGTDQERVRLTVTPRPGQPPIGLAVGNGIEGAWRGYFSQSSDVMTLDVDLDRMVPLREQHRRQDDRRTIEIRYSEYIEPQPGQLVPQRIDVLPEVGLQWVMRFAWQQNAVWMLTQAEIDANGRTEVVARVRDVRVDDERLLVEWRAQKERRSVVRALLSDMLDRNRPWLFGNYSGVESLSYVFHTQREDVREACVIGPDGTTVFEVVHDGQGKMGEWASRRSIALPTGEWGSSRRDDPLALIEQPDPKSSEPSRARQLQHYGRIGCQLDLPLFEYRDLLDKAAIDVQDGAWNGSPCHVAKVSGAHRRAYLGFGTMLCFTSWSYMHHLQPALETLYIDKERMVPIHETFVSARDNQVIEIDFSDYRELEPGAWAPLSIRIEQQGHFTCVYRFQIVGESHWLLSEVESWFDPMNKSRGVIEGVVANQPSPLLQAAQSQVEASRRLFAPADTRGTQRWELPVFPFRLGHRWTMDDIDAVFTVEQGKLVLQVSTGAGTSSDAKISAILIDANNRLLAAATGTCAEREGRGEAAVPFGQSSALARAAKVAIWKDNAPLRDGAIPVSVNGYALGESPLTINVLDQHAGDTRLNSLSLLQDASGMPMARVSLVSRDGPAEFDVDASVCVVDRSGRLVASGMQRDTVRVAGHMVQKTLGVPLGGVPILSESSFVLAGITRGRTSSRPMGSVWGRMLDSTPLFPIDELLAAEDEACWKSGIDGLMDPYRRGGQDLSAFLEDPERREDDELRERRIQSLQPHANRLAHIATHARDSRLVVLSLWLVGLAEDRGQAETIAPLLTRDSSVIQDAAAVALGILGRADGIQRLPALLSVTDAELSSRQALSQLPDDRPLVAAANWHATALLSLIAIGTDRAVEILAERARQDLLAAMPEAATDAQRPTQRLYRLWRALGFIERSAAAAELRTAAERLLSDPQLATGLDPSPLMIALLEHEDSMSDVLRAIVGGGSSAAAAVLRNTRQPMYVPAVRAAVFAPTASQELVYQSTRYLWNAGTPDAVALLAEMYDRRIPADPHGRMLAARALAALGDFRGFPEAFDAMRLASEPSEPPDDAKARRDWERDREQRRDAGLDVFDAAPGATRAQFVVQHAATRDVATQLSCLSIAESLHYLPPEVQGVLERWQDSPDKSVQVRSEKLLQRRP